MQNEITVVVATKTSMRKPLKTTQEFISESNSPYSLRLVIVEKKDSSVLIRDF